MKCIVVTPEKKVVDAEAKFVVLPLYDGEFGVETGRAPVVGRLGAGELRLTLPDGSVERWYVEGGFVEVANDVVSLLTNRACELKSLDLAAARDALSVALATPATGTTTRERAVRLARLRVRAAEKAAALKD